MARLHRVARIGCVAVLLLSGSTAALSQTSEPVDTIKDVYARIRSCWKRPDPSRVHSDIDITVIVSFNRAGEILGRPRVTYESEQADDNDRLIYRIAVMEALQRCTPMPFTEGMAGAVAGRPFAIRFRNRRPPPAEKRAWLIPKIL